MATTRLLFVAYRPPFPLASGARIRSHRLLTGLAEAFETTFLTFEHHELSAEGHVARDELQRLLPGIGVLTLNAFGSYDLPVLLGGVLVGSVVLVLMNLLVDIAYTFLDPRVRLG